YHHLANPAAHFLRLALPSERAHERTSTSSQDNPFASNISEKARSGESLRAEPGKSREHHQCLPVVAAFVQDQCEIRVAIRLVLSARPRTKQYCPLQPYISGNPRQEIAYSTLGIW